MAKPPPCLQGVTSQRRAGDRRTTAGHGGVDGVGSGGGGGGGAPTS